MMRHPAWPAALPDTVSFADLDDIWQRLVPVDATDPAALAKLGIVITGRTDCTLLVHDAEKSLGKIHIQNAGANSLLVFDNRGAPGGCHLSARLNAPDGALIFVGLTGAIVNLPMVFLRRAGQVLFWGAGATAVQAQIELEGAGASLLVGDDCMLSNDIWIRNYDMHTAFDLTSETILNNITQAMVLEQHVWVGQGVILLGASVGYGSIVGAKSLAKGHLARTSSFGGIPARLLRANTSWCRSVTGITPATRERLARLAACAAAEAAGSNAEAAHIHEASPEGDTAND